MQLPPVPPPKSRNLARTAEASARVRSEVVLPLRSGVVLAAGGLKSPELLRQSTAPLTTRGSLESAAAKAMPEELQTLSRQLGVAGGALGGVAGFGTLVGGVRRGDRRAILHGVTDVAASASFMAAAGALGGALVLTPAAGALLGLRGLQSLERRDSWARLNGAGDVLMGSMLLARALQAPSTLSLGLGAAATAVGLVRGLHSLAQDRPSSRIRGVGEVAASVGVALVASGLATVPGLGVILAGVSLPLLQRVPFLRKPVDALVDRTSRALQPLARGNDRILERAGRRARPLLAPLRAARMRLRRPLQPLRRRLRVASTSLLRLSRRGLEALERTRAVEALDRAAGAVNRWLLPPPETPDPRP